MLTGRLVRFVESILRSGGTAFPLDRKHEEYFQCLETTTPDRESPARDASSILRHGGELKQSLYAAGVLAKTHGAGFRVSVCLRVFASAASLKGWKMGLPSYQYENWSE